MRGVNTTKLLILAILGFCAVVLGSAVLTLQLYVAQEKQRLGLLGIAVKIDSSHSVGVGGTTVTTIRPSQPITSDDIQLASKYPPPQGLNYKTVQQAYWRQAAAFLREWDALLLGDDDENDNGEGPSRLASGTDTPLLIPSPQKGLDARWALQQAANAGHPVAQHYWANAHASGIWPTMGNYSSDLHVFDEWSPTTHGDHPQLTKAFLLWHMAAMGGNIESAMALAHRISELSDDVSEEDNDTMCLDVLPYLEAAAHGIVDELEASPHSRAKVLPPMDKHILAQVHMHGGTSSQLDWNNKPHESKEAIQFYHLKATTTPWSTRMYASESEESGIDIHAAYTLGHLYHYGVRGVPQNLTQSLLYYNIAAHHGHWESAGEAGTFYLWGMGTHQNVQKAHELFQIGAPYGLEGCRRKHEQALLNKDAETEIMECDATSLNGMGVLYLLGIPDELEVDLSTAEKYFALAKELGNADAMYHLSMMWLGWKTHFKHVDDLVDNGMSEEPNEVFGDSKKKVAQQFALHYSPRTDQVTKGPIQSEIQDAIKLLTLAANKGHLQAKHRLAMIYSEGISIQTATLKYDAVKPSCTKAKALYQWITEHASIQRSKRLRQAYNAYMDGDLEVSLRNYLAAGETGSNVGQVNAAFLLERGTCLGLSPADCAKASVRLWKAASARGNTEACLRVGDFYYYGRLRGSPLPAGPFRWVQYLLFPEEHLPGLLFDWGMQLWNTVREYLPEDYQDLIKVPTRKEPEPTLDEIQHQKEMLEADLSTAAYYYTEAAEKFHSPRANFNLGFMYEWGLGLKQDFPLAKRHYDLAASINHGKEAELAVQIALWAMSAHEYMVKLHVSWNEWQRKRASSKSPTSIPTGSGSLSPRAGQSEKTAQDVILSHIFNWSSFLIAVLIYIVMQLQKVRERRQQRRRR